MKKWILNSKPIKNGIIKHLDENHIIDISTKSINENEAWNSSKGSAKC